MLTTKRDKCVEMGCDMLRTIETTLWPLEEHPEAGIGLSVYLNAADAPELAGLTEGERVLLVEPNELQADGIARLIEIDGRRYWYAEIGSRDAIQVIYRESAVSGNER